MKNGTPMANTSHDAGALLALIQNWDLRTRPRLEKIKANVDAGELLTEGELEFLEQISGKAGHNEALFERNPEYKRLYAMAVGLYKEITERALQNERSTSDQ
jgi:hypothetical protein